MLQFITFHQLTQSMNQEFKHQHQFSQYTKQSIQLVKHNQLIQDQQL